MSASATQGGHNNHHTAHASLMLRCTLQ